MMTLVQVTKVYLANVQLPKSIKKLGPKEQPVYSIPWMYDGRDFLRKKFIGKTVTVTMDFVDGDKSYATVKSGTNNLGAMVIYQVCVCFWWRGVSALFSPIGLFTCIYRIYSVYLF